MFFGAHPWKVLGFICFKAAENDVLESTTLTGVPGPPCIYMLKLNQRNTRTRCEICSSVKNRPGDFIVNFEHISHLIVMFLLLILNMYLQAGALIWPTSEDKRLSQRLSKLVGFFIISSVLPKTKTTSFFKKRGISSKLPRISNIWCNITRIWKPWFVILRILIKTPRFQSK